MRHVPVRGFLCAVGTLCVQLSLPAASEVTVPFVGCRSEGQAGPLGAPKGTVTSVLIGGRTAQALAYYGSALDLGVLAPRGWYCVGIYGSGGDFLYVSSEPNRYPQYLCTEVARL